nr:GGDEF domain-containing protein [Vibrio sinensis]
MTFRVAMEADDVVTRVLFDAAAEHLQFNVDYVYHPSFDSILTSVKNMESDFAANVTYTDERAAYFDFSSPTNIEYTYLYSRTNATLESISRVGIPKGTIYGELIRVNYPEIVQVEYLGHEHAKSLLENGEVDGVVDAINQLKPMLLAGFDAQLLNHQVSIKPVSIVAPKGKHRLILKQIEKYVHSAEVQKLLRESINQYQFDIRQQALRQQSMQIGANLYAPLRVKIENVSQYAMYNADGTVAGIAADVLFQACDILLLKCVLVSDADETWEHMYSSFFKGEIDIIAPLTISEHRKAIAYFSDPYYFPAGIMVKREGYKNNVYSNVSELIVERIGVVEDDFYEELLGSLLPQKTLHSYDNIQQQIDALLNNEIDYVAINRPSYNKLLRDANQLLPLEQDTLIGTFYTSEIAIGFTKNELGKQLAPLFSRALKMLDTEKIINTYDFQPNWKATLQTEQRSAKLIQGAFAFVLLFLIVISLYLNKQSNTDNLTKLSNRRALHRRFRSGVSPNLTFVYLDVNDFKPINDTYGHDVGDQVLKKIAKQSARYWKGQTYRIGGDEFILVGQVDNVDLSYTLLNLNKFEYVSEERDVRLGVSLAIGVSRPRDSIMTLEEVLHEADQSMYSNKRSRDKSYGEERHEALQNVVPISRI